MRRLMALFDLLGIPLATDKVCRPSTCITFLGIQINSVECSISLPPDKLEHLLALLSTWKDKRSCKKRELLSLIGHLSFAAKVVKPGRLFLRRLIDASTRAQHLHHRIHISAETRRDIDWWLAFLPSWNGVAYIQSPPIPNNELHLFTDASALGIGGVFGDRWFSLPLSTFSQAPWLPPQAEPFNINFWELVALVVAFHTWGAHFQDMQVAIHTDNLPLVHIWSRGSRNRHVMRLIRALFLRTARSNTNLLLLHIPGHSNVLADALSRLQVRRFQLLHPSAEESPTPLHPDIWQI